MHTNTQAGNRIHWCWHLSWNYTRLDPRSGYHVSVFSFVLFADSMICSRQRPNSSITILSCTTGGIFSLSASSAWANRQAHVASATSEVKNVYGSLSPVEVIWGRRDGIPDIWEDSFDFAAVCCWTLTSAASAKCIKVFLSGLSSKFLHPIHLQELEHIIFAS